MREKENIDNIERLEVMEEKFGISLEGLFVTFEKLDFECLITITGEIHALNGTAVSGDFTLTAAAFDSEGRVIANASQHIYKEDFHVLAPIDIGVLAINKPVKIRIYPHAK